MSETETTPLIDICGVLIHAKPGESKAVGKRLTAISGVEIHKVTDDNRLIVTVENTSETEPGTSVGDVLNQLQSIEGVLMASMIYQYTDDEQPSSEHQLET